MFVVLLAVVGLAVWAAVRLGRHPDAGSSQVTPVPGRPPGDARALLDHRLAAGEIDAEEYRRLRQLIES